MKKPQSKPSYFNFRRLPHGVLVAGDLGGWALLTPAEFKLFSSGKLTKGPGLAKLERAGLISSRLDFDALCADWRDSNDYLERGPGLHILVLTQNCNHGCVYCQAGSGRGASMSPAAARRAVDFAFSAPVEGLTLEFQGGEPLLNWPALKAAALYARSKAAKTGKELALALVSNFSTMTEEKAEFLISNDISVCTSLDGPADLHNANRPFSGGDSHARAVKWIKYFQRRRGGLPPGGPSALLTVTRASLGRAPEIVDEYARLKLPYVFLRPLTPMGQAPKRWGEIGYGPEEFLEFYRAGLNRVLALNRRGVKIKEKTAFLLVKKILGSQDNKYVDLRCPCGAGLGQLAYDCDGGIYTCDEGRMLARDGDNSFRLGGVRDGYARIINSFPVKACALSSSLDLQPACARCAYKAWCGACPAYNSAAQGGFWGSMPSNARCRILTGVFDHIFALLAGKDNLNIFNQWLEN
ncbi:MAG TPA: His-Xaa-Ser system radical SAM maturase HxsB [Elusimicrobia bacterium]|nr:MAG: His-Xaa-Ser system radical SAM maturase HxsB [Elusimicrobia bacterium GWD2_63_28]HCC48232.1 His-Xaa-Ser system radical SAM maturase HxsB [Elusimicrobiota bacterium]